MFQSKEDLEYMGRKLQEVYSKWGFTMNIAKTKYMSVGTDTNHLDKSSGRLQMVAYILLCYPHYIPYHSVIL